MSEKCFCHLNGYKVKDADVRNEIDFGKSMNTVTDNSITITDGRESPLESFSLLGHSYQNGTPSPDNPIEITTVTDVDSVTVNVCGRNYIPYPYVDSDKTVSGLTFTVNSDGSIRVTGTSTNVVKFTLWGSDDNTTSLAYFKYGYYTASDKVVYKIMPYGTPTTNTWKLNQGDTITHIYIQYESGVTVNETLYPMFVSGNELPEYEQYVGCSATLTSGFPLYSAGNIADEIIYNADGTAKVIKRFGSYTLDGSESYSKSSGTPQIDINSNKYWTIKKNANSTMPNIICEVFKADKADNIWLGVNNNSISFNSLGTIVLNSSSFSTAEDAKAYFTSYSTEFIAELAVPQEFELTAEEVSQLENLKVYDGVTRFNNSVNAPMKVTYYNKKILALESRIEKLEREIDTKIEEIDDQIDSKVEEFEQEINTVISNIQYPIAVNGFYFNMTQINASEITSLLGYGTWAYYGECKLTNDSMLSVYRRIS